MNERWTHAMEFARDNYIVFDHRAWVFGWQLDDGTWYYSAGLATRRTEVADRTEAIQRQLGRPL